MKRPWGKSPIFSQSILHPSCRIGANPSNGSIHLAFDSGQLEAKTTVCARGRPAAMTTASEAALLVIPWAIHAQGNVYDRAGYRHYLGALESERGAAPSSFVQSPG